MQNNNHSASDAPDARSELIGKIQSMTKEELDLFISLAVKELGLQAS